jgi:flagellar biosynthetic protein FliR
MTQAQIDTYYVHFICFFFVMMRVSGAFFFAPVFGSETVFDQIKVWMAVFIAFVMFPSISEAHGITRSLPFPAFVLYSIKELTVGAIIGFLTNMPFLAVRVGSEIVGRMSGFGMGDVISPDVDENISLISQMVYILVIMFFLMINGHHLVLRMLAKSFELIPLGKYVFSGKITTVATRLFASVFDAGIAYSAPILGILIILSMTMGILGKMVPELNVMIFILPIQVAVGLLAVLFTMPLLFSVVRHLQAFTEKCTSAIILCMSGGAG